jgi:hypothetical protein
VAVRSRREGRERDAIVTGSVTANVTPLKYKLAMQLIDIGYKALATKLHPDKGGSGDAMSRLNEVRDRLKQRA